MTLSVQNPVESFQVLAHAVPEILPPILNQVFHTSFAPDAEVQVGLTPSVTAQVSALLGTEAARIANMIIRVREKSTGWEEYYLHLNTDTGLNGELEVVAQLIAIQEIRDGCLPATVHDLPQTGILPLQ